MKRSSYAFFVSVIVLTLTLVWSQFLMGENQTVARKSFVEFPLNIGGWQGRELGLDKGVLDVLQLDDYMMRTYTKEGKAPIMFYVGYYKRLGKVAYHSPKYCLPGGGWQIIDRRLVDIPVDPSQKNTIRVNYVILEKGVDKQLFLYWYQDRGRIITSDYLAKFYVLWDSITRNRTDGGLVRFSSFITSTEEAAFRQLSKFVQSTFPLSRDYLPG